MKIRLTHRFTFVGLLLAFILTSCTRSCSKSSVTEMGPEEVVKQFVELSAQAKSPEDKKRLENLCSGEMKRAFERMTDEVFRISYLSNNVKISDLKILEAKVQGESAAIHYQVSVENAQGTDPTREVNEREVELTRTQGAWTIDSIRLRGTDKVAFVNGMMF